MNIFFLLIDLASGGSERVTAILASELASKGYSVSIVLLDNRISYPLHKDIKVLMLDKPKMKSKLHRIFHYIWQLHKIIESPKDTILVAMLNTMLHYSVILSLFSPVKVFACERNDPYAQYKSFQEKALRKLCFHLSDFAIFQTESAKLFYPRSVRSKSAIIPNPIVLPNEKWRSENIDYKTLVSIGRLEKQKNLPMLLLAMIEVKKKHPDARLILYGEGTQRQLLTKMVDQLELTSTVSFGGYVNNVSKVLADEASVYISSSDFEGISNSILEALSIGVPVCATDCPGGGTAMLITSEYNGMLSPVGDSQLLARNILHLLDNKSISIAFSKMAIERSRQFSSDIISSRWLALFHSVQSG